MAARREYTVFLASPSADTLNAREAVAAVVRGINVDPQYEPDVQLKLLRWDDPDRTVALSAETNGQVDVIEQVGDPARCDLLIGIFRHTLGGKLPPERFPHPDGRAWHCTEWEVDQALQGKRVGTVRTVWRFRDVTDFPARKARHTELEWAQIDARHRAVSAYFEELNLESDTQRHSTNEYEGVPHLAKKINDALRSWVSRQLAKDQALQPSASASTHPLPADLPLDADPLTPNQLALHTLLVADQPPELDEAYRKLAAQASKGSVTGWRSHLLKRYATWCTGSGGQLDRRFVNLTLMIDRLPGVEGERFAPDASQRDEGRYDDLADLLANQPDAGAWLLVGDPGCGKSTVLQHHELSTAQAALRAIALGADPQELCFWVRLSDYSAASAEPAEWLAQRWAGAVGDRLPAWPQACQRLRIRVLADGLNEIKAPDAAAQGEAMRRWAAWAAGLADAGAGHLAPVFSVRTLEIGDGVQVAGLALRYITLGLWADPQIEQYCLSRQADEVWRGLQRPDREGLRELCRLPFNLAAQCELFQAGGTLAADRAELLSGVVWQRIIHEHRKASAGALAAAGLLGPGDTERIGSGQWRQALRALPEQGWLVRGLDAQAERLHRGGREVSFSKDDALDAFDDFAAHAEPPKRSRREAPVAPPDAVDWLEAAQALAFIGVSGIDKFTGATSLRYTHQLWQEFFAGRSLRERPPAQGTPAEAADGRFTLPDLRPPVLTLLCEVLARLGTQDPLPSPGVSTWEEPVKLALQLSTRPVDWLRHLLGVNMPLAGRAAAACLSRLESDATGRALLVELRTALLTRSRHAGTDLRLRIEAAEALGRIGDPRYEEGHGPGPDRQRFLIPKAAQWVQIPGGHYRIGTAGGANDEQPITSVHLKAFEMAFAPVTNAEYRCFIEAGGYEDERWWVGDTAQRWWREGIRNETEIERLGRLFADLRENFDATVKRYPNLTEANLEQWRSLAALSEVEADQQLNAWYGAQTFRLPGEWANPRFNGPAQPVVGLCIFEAQAYCRWLTAQTGRSVRLPTEAEWEAAARGADAWRWPWGESDPEPGQINDDAAHLRRTSPVGVFPASDTPEGLGDMSGNVWEWTTSVYTEQLEMDALTTEAPDGSALRAVRGGSWSNRSGGCRAGVRGRVSPVDRSYDLGFRVVCCPIHEP